MEAGARFLSPNEYHDLVKGSVAPSVSRPGVLVTFDDGTLDLHQHRNILAERGIRPLVFMPSAFLGRKNSWEWPIPGRRTRHLSGDHLRELIEAGWEIGLHGASHCDLTRLGDDRLGTEISVAREELQEAVGRSVRFFSYPFGRTAPQVTEQVRSAGFTAAFVLSARNPGENSEDLFRMARRPVYCIDSSGDVLAKVMDPSGRSLFGRWQHWKESSAHGVGKWAAGRWSFGSRD